MDKIATNNLIVELRTDVKAAKSMVAGNLVRKINDLKKALEKNEDAVKKEKADKKIDALHADIRLLKTIDPYLICKNAILKPDPKHWTNLVGDSKASDELKLIARVIAKGRIQKQVAKFRSDHPDCGEWLEEYFEFREKKRELTEVKVAKRKTKQQNKPGKAPKKPNMNKNPGRPKRGSDQNGESAKKSGVTARRDDSKRQNGPKNRNANESKSKSNNAESKQEALHPSWASKRKEKEILKAALSGKAPAQPKRVILNPA